MKTAVFGVADSEDQAINIVDRLKVAGFSGDDVSDPFPEGSKPRHFAYERRTRASWGAALGSASGLILGAIFGLFVGTGVLPFPGLESLAAAGVIIAVLAGAGGGALLGEVTGLILGLQTQKFEALPYEDKMDSGNILISVHTEGGVERDRAKEVFENPDAVAEVKQLPRDTHNNASLEDEGGSSMKTVVKLLAGAIVCWTLAVSAFAQSTNDKVGSAEWTKPDGTKVTLEADRGPANPKAEELRAFQSAKSADTSFATDLAKNPNLIASDSYVAQHPALQQFLQQYPGAREDIQANPGNFLVPTQGSTWNASTVGKTSNAQSN